MKTTIPNPKLCPLSQAIAFSEDMIPIIEKAMFRINKLLRSTRLSQNQQNQPITDDFSPDLIVILKSLENISKQLANLYAIKKFDWTNCIHNGKNKGE